MKAKGWKGRLKAIGSDMFVFCNNHIFLLTDICVALYNYINVNVNDNVIKFLRNRLSSAVLSDGFKIRAERNYVLIEKR